MIFSKLNYYSVAHTCQVSGSGHSACQQQINLIRRATVETRWFGSLLRCLCNLAVHHNFIIEFRFNRYSDDHKAYKVY